MFQDAAPRAAIDGDIRRRKFNYDVGHAIGIYAAGDCMFRELWRKSLLVAAFVCLGTGSAHADCKMAVMLVMPITMAGTQPLVTVKLNGVETRMLMDTGSFFSFIAPEAAKRAALNIGLAPPSLVVEGLGGTVRPEEATVQDFTIGNQTLHRVSLLVYGDQFSGNGVDGVLGQNFLRLGDIEIDLANGVARLFRNTGCEHANLAYWGGSAPVGVLDIQPTDKASPNVIAHAQLNGTDIRVLFDTGASFSQLALYAAQKAGITPQSPGVAPGGFVHGVGREVQDSWIAPFKSFKLDTEETLNTRLRIGDMGMLARTADMLLGGDFFLSHHIFIVYGERKVFFTYNGGPVFDLRVRGAAPAADKVQPPGSDSPGIAAAAAAATVVISGANSTSTGLSTLGSAAEYDRRATASVARGDLPAAIADLGLAITAEPGNAQYRLHRGGALIRSGDVRQGLADLNEALRLQPDLTDALMLRALIRTRSNNLDGAKADFAAAEASAPGRYELRLQEAGDYVATGRYPLALDVLNGWITAHPHDERLYDALADRCLVRGMLGTELDAALSDCNTARRNASGNSQILYNRGIVQLRRKEYDKAISDFNDTVALQPRLARAIYARGLARIAKGDKAAGDADLQAALAIEPRVANVLRDIALTP
jgi:tetratricopeptide (TPR) repeat protein